MSTHSICFYGEIGQIIPELSSNIQNGQVLALLTKDHEVRVRITLEPDFCNTSMYRASHYHTSVTTKLSSNTPLNPCHAEYIKMPHPFLIFSQSDYMILVVYTNSHTELQCRSRSVGFRRSQLIWIYTVCKGRAYQGLTNFTELGVKVNMPLCHEGVNMLCC